MRHRFRDAPYKGCHCPTCTKRRAYYRARRQQNRVALRTSLLERDGPDCAHCGHPLGDVLDGGRVHIDHDTPRHAGGEGSRDCRRPHPNLRLLHAGCNLDRRDKGHHLPAPPEDDPLADYDL